MLRYAGYPIEELAKSSHFVEVMWLLLHQQLPSAQQLAQFTHEITYHTMLHEDLKLRGPGELLGTAQHGELSLQVADLFKDAELLSLAADGVVIVIEPGRTRRQTVKNHLESLEEKKANLLGAVLNKRVFHVPEIFYGKT